MHLSIFAGNIAFTIELLAVFGICGWWALSPFQKWLRYPALMAPLSGILVVTLVSLSIYTLCKLSFLHSVIAAVGLSLATSTASWIFARPVIRFRESICPLLIGLLVIAAAVWFTTITSTRLGEATFLYVDGTDHLGYAHLADWIISHRVTEIPATDPAKPYESWPALLFQIDPRFGSFSFLALVSLAADESAMFSYDLAASIALSAGIMGVAAVFAASGFTLVLLAVGLFSSHWFDYGRIGFFGKLLAYPSAFFVAGLFMQTATRTRLTPLMIAAMAALAAGTALMHSGAATGVFIGLIGMTFLIGRALFSRKIFALQSDNNIFDAVVVLVLLVAVAVISSGIIARPLGVGFPDWNTKWPYVLPRIFDLENQGVALSGFSSGSLSLVTQLMLFFWVTAAMASVLLKNEMAGAVLIGPLALLAGLYLLNVPGTAFQMIGTFYPLGLCGISSLLDSVNERRALAVEMPFRMRHDVLALLILAFALIPIGFHFPRFFGAVSRYGGDETPVMARFSKSSFDHLAEVIGNEPVDVDIPIPQSALAVLAELGRRGITLQWSPRSWNAVLGYRPWAPPHYLRRGTFRLTTRKESKVPRAAYEFLSPQYRLIRQSPYQQ